MGVEVRYVLGQRNLKLAPVKDQHPIQQLTANGGHPSLGDRVRPGSPHRCAHDTHALTGEHGIEEPVNLLSRSRIKNLN
jgi:hypothetical protein